MNNVRILPEAALDLSTAADFYNDDSQELALEFLADFENVCDLLKQYPDAGKSVSEKLRQYPLSRFPFSVIYSVQDRSVVVIAVSHHRRKPGYGQSLPD